MRGTKRLATHTSNRLQGSGGRDPQCLDRNLPASVDVFRHIRSLPPVWHTVRLNVV